MSADYKALATLLRGLGHPLRLEALDAIAEGSDSPVAVWHKLQVNRSLSLSLISYHVGSLARAGLIEQYAEQRVRGADKHLYRITERGQALVSCLRALDDA